jgi:ribosomal protein L27
LFSLISGVVNFKHRNNRVFVEVCE